MPLRRRSESRAVMGIWPGFVDALTAMLLVITFVLSIFMITQHFLRDTIMGQEAALTDKDAALSALSEEVRTLAGVLSLEERARSEAEDQLAQVQADLSAARLSLAETVSERDTEREEAALIAAQRQAFEALTQSLQTELEDTRVSLTDAKARRLTESAAAKLLQERLEGAEAELTAMTLDLEAQRKEAEETLLLLAGAREAQGELSAQLDERGEALALAKSQLAEADETTLEEKKQVALLNEQTRVLREQLQTLNLRLEGSEKARDLLKTDVALKDEEIKSLGTRLNVALAERTKLLEEQVDELEDFRSEFFGRVRAALAERDDVQIVGDRFVFQSEVLFAPGSADLGSAGEGELSKFAEILNEISSDLPDDLNWILRIDGHTDVRPLAPGRTPFRNNWELSQARALSVAEFLINREGVDPKRLVAAGFGEHQPIDNGDDLAAYARNRRIELKLTER